MHVIIEAKQSILKRKRALPAFLAVLACFLLSGVAFAQAESEKSLEEFMSSNEPAQPPSATSVVGLKGAAVEVESNDKEATESAFLSNLKKAIGDEEESESDDALPDVSTRLGSDFEGMGVGLDQMILPIDEAAILEKRQEELEEEIRRDAFDAAMTGLFPLRPDQVKALLLEYDLTKRAVKEPVYGVPTPQINVSTVSLDPGTAPMIITTATGHVTTLNILDVTGAPWPIHDVSWAGDFEVLEPEEGGHILRITPLEQAAYGNMSIRLLTLKTPVTIMLRTSKDEVQYRVDARIPEYGPFAQTPLIEGGSERVAGNALITSILDGVAPGAAERLSVDGVDGRTSAYNFQGMTYVRTPLTLLSPGWEQSISSADGMNVYALSQTPVLLLSDKGRFMRVGLKKAGDLSDE